MRRFQTHRDYQPYHQPRRSRIFQAIRQGVVIGIAFGLIVNVMSKRIESNDENSGSGQARLSQSQIAANSLSPLDKINQKINNAMAKAKIKSRMTAEEPPENETSEPENLALKSLFCSTPEAARAEVLEKVRQAIAERLAKYNLDDRQSVTTAMKSMNLNLAIDESSKEVAGEKYPLYTGRVEVVFDKDFESNIVKLVTHRTAQNRFEWLMSASILIVAALILLDQTLWNTRLESKQANAADSIPA